VNKTSRSLAAAINETQSGVLARGRGARLKRRGPRRAQASDRRSTLLVSWVCCCCASCTMLCRAVVAVPSLPCLTLPRGCARQLSTARWLSGGRRQSVRFETTSIMRAPAAPAYDQPHGQHRTLASYSGRGKPTRTRVREREEEADTTQTRNAALSQRLSEAPAHATDDDQARTIDSLQDAGLKTFMAKVCKLHGTSHTGARGSPVVRSAGRLDHWRLYRDGCCWLSTTDARSCAAAESVDPSYRNDRERYRTPRCAQHS
jgi:hypothetical protein